MSGIARRNFIWSALKLWVGPLLWLMITLAAHAALAQGTQHTDNVTSKPARISVAYCNDCVPFHFQNKDGEADGLIIDMWRLWSKRTGIAVDFKPAAWEETLKMVADGRADAHAGLFFSNARAKFLEYGASLTKTDTRLFINKNLRGVNSMKDLDAYRIGVLSGDYVEGFLKKKFPPENIIGFKSYDVIMAALRKGSLQVFAADMPTGIFHLQKAGLGYVFKTLAGKPLYTRKWFVAAAKGNTKLIKIINDGMALITQDERHKIESSWVSVSNPNILKVRSSRKRLVLTDHERQWIANHPLIRVHNETSWPPFNFYKDGRPQGFSIDYMNLLASMIGVKVKYVTGPTWNEFLGMMKSGKLDVMLNIVKTPDRQKYLLYTKPYAYNPNSILSRREAPYNSIKQLFGKTVALPKGFFYEEILKRDYPQIKLYLVKNVIESMKAVAFGKADAALGELAVFNYLIGREMMTGLVLSGEVNLGGSNYSQLNIATRKDLPLLISILRKAMNVVSPGEIKALRRRWINVATTNAPPQQPKLKLTKAEKAWLAKHKHIRMGVDPNYPPFDFIAKDGTYSGMASSYARLIGKRLGVTLDVVPGLSWRQVIKGVKSGTVDMLPAVTKTPKRNKFMNFSREYLNFPDVIFMRDGHTLIAGLSDLKGRKVALVKGYATARYVETNYPTIQSQLVETPLLALEAVAEGKADATVQNLGVATYLINKHNLGNLVVAAPAKMNMPGLSFGVRKDWPELVSIINKALASIPPEKEAAIREKWGSTQYQIGINTAKVRRMALQAGGVGAIIFIFIFIWNRRLQNEIKNRKRAEDHLRLALDHMSDGIYQLDNKQRYVLFNDRCKELLQIPDDLIKIGRPVIDAVRYLALRGDYGNVDVEEYISHRMTMFECGEVFKVELETPSGILEFRQAPTSDGGTVVVSSDVTDRKRNAEVLVNAKDAAELANHAKSQFLSSMSHELRTPMNAILGFGQMLESNPKEPLSKAQKRCVRHIMKGGHYLLELINEVLDLAKIESGKMELSIEDVTVKDIFVECLSLIQTLAEKRGIKIVDRDCLESGMVVRADYSRFTQVLLNLMSNAVKYNRENGKITIQCREAPGGMFHIAVSDTGEGIPEDRKEQLFQPFSRLGAENTEIEGTGIGLTITKQLVEKMDGHIGFDSIVGEGSTFWIELPLAEKKLIDNQNYDKEKNTDVAKRLPSVAALILYVEDNPANLDLMEMIISRVPDLSMISAHNAEIGIELSRQKDPDLIILDINLPGMDGFAALEELKKLEETKHIPIIALSAAAMPKDIRKGMDAGFKQYLTKPINVDEVVEAIKSNLETR